MRTFAPSDIFVSPFFRTLFLDYDVYSFLSVTLYCNFVVSCLLDKTEFALSGIHYISTQLLFSYIHNLDWVLFGQSFLIQNQVIPLLPF